MIKYLYYIHDKKTIFHDAVILLCKRHKGIGVQIDHFDIVKNIFIESLCEVAGIEPNSEIARNWSDIIDYIRDAFAEC
jgi:hemoglobin-like flavoprotein